MHMNFNDQPTYGCRYTAGHEVPHIGAWIDDEHRALKDQIYAYHITYSKGHGGADVQHMRE